MNIAEIKVEETTPPLAFGYLNYRGEFSIRSALPMSVAFASTEWHPEPQWLLHAFDTEKKAMRSFAMRDMSGLPRKAGVPLPISPLGRAELKEIFDCLEELEAVIANHVVYAKARSAISLIEAVRSHVGDTLPGGFADFCEGCGKPLGENEIAARDHENALSFCADCGPTEDDVARQQAEAGDDAAAVAVEGQHIPEGEAWIASPSDVVATLADAPAPAPIVVDGWTIWEAPDFMIDGPRPVDPTTLVQLRFRDGDQALHPTPAGDWNWTDFGSGMVIAAYRLAPVDGA